MPERPPVPLLQVHPPSGPGAGSPAPNGPPRPVAELIEALADEESVDQRSVALPAGPWPLALWRVGRALGELVVAGEGEGERGRAVQWPVPDRWPVVHAHGAAALRATWVAAAWRGSGARVVAGPLPEAAGREGSDGDAGVRAPRGPWRKADLVTAPDRGTLEALARRGVEYRRLRLLPPGDAGAALRLYRRLSHAERRRAQRVDWSVASSGSSDAGLGAGARGEGEPPGAERDAGEGP